MSTPRRRWFRVADSIGVEPWDNDLVATAVRILAAMNTRRSRDGLSSEDAVELLVGPTELQRLTGKGRRDVAETLLRRLADVTATSVERRGDVYAIKWPKVAEFQGWPARDLPSPTPAPAPAPAPISGPKTLEKREIASPPAPPDRPRADQGTRPPERLSDQERAELRTWALAKAPALCGRLLELEEACLDYFRAQVGARGRKASWPLTVRTWIRTEAERERRRVNGAARVARTGREWTPAELKEGIL